MRRLRCFYCPHALRGGLLFSFVHVKSGRSCPHTAAVRGEQRGVKLRCPKCKVVLKLKPEHAGRKIKCPKCAAAFRVPAPQPEPEPEPEPAPVPDLTAQAPAEAACPNCNADMAPAAVICMACGYNRRTGKQLSTDLEE